MSSSLAGALMITFFAPASGARRALSASVKTRSTRGRSRRRDRPTAAWRVTLLEDLDLATVDDQGVLGVVDRARIGAVGRIVLEEQRVDGTCRRGR